MSIEHSPTRGDATSRADFLTNYVSEEEFAEAIGVSVRTIARWRRRREAPASTRIGRKVYFSRAAVDAWLEAREQPQAA